MFADSFLKYKTLQCAIFHSIKATCHYYEAEKCKNYFLVLTASCCLKHKSKNLQSDIITNYFNYLLY